jgi:hypothetical protein
MGSLRNGRSPAKRRGDLRDRMSSIPNRMFGTLRRRRRFPVRYLTANPRLAHGGLLTARAFLSFALTQPFNGVTDD